MRLTVTKEFLENRDKCMAEYNHNGRTPNQVKMNIDCELYEFTMISEGKWSASPDWYTDGVDEYGIRFEVKHRPHMYYAFKSNRLPTITEQLEKNDYIIFFKKVDWPNRPLKEGDEVEIEVSPAIACKAVLEGDRLRPSKFRSNEHYLDHRGLN